MPDRPSLSNHPDLQGVLETAGLDLAVRAVHDRSSRDPNGVFEVVPEAGEPLAAKFAREPEDEGRIPREIAVLSALGGTEAPVPDLVAARPDPDDAPPFYVARKCPGTGGDETVGAGDPSPALLGNLGETMARVHRARTFDAHGTIEGIEAGTPVVDGRDRWSDALLDLVDRRVADLRGSRFEMLAAEVRSSVADRADAVDAGQAPVVVHNDLAPYNVLVDDGRIRCVIDWELALVGAGEYDLCRTEENALGALNSPPEERLQRALFDGYRSVRDLEDGFERRREIYRVALPLRSLRTFDSWGPRTADDPGELADRIRELVRARMSAPNE